MTKGKREGAVIKSLTCKSESRFSTGKYNHLVRGEVVQVTGTLSLRNTLFDSDYASLLTDFGTYPHLLSRYKSESKRSEFKT